VEKIERAQPPARIADERDLGVRGDVERGDHAVRRSAQHLAIAHEAGADRRLAGKAGTVRGFERQTHVAFVGRGRIRQRRPGCVALQVCAHAPSSSSPW
jgi:hypothetical protein